MTTIRIDEPNVADTTEGAAQLSPVLSQRRWEQEAEGNVLERLEAIWPARTSGRSGQGSQTVLNNLVVTNRLNLERPLHSRILLTSPLESFTVGHTIVLSRGLIDVLPDEASLATMLAHELSHVALGHQLIDTKFSFADRLMVPDGELLQALRFRRTPRRRPRLTRRSSSCSASRLIATSWPTPACFFGRSRSRPSSCLGSYSRTSETTWRPTGR